MKNYISEDDIEQASIKLLAEELGYEKIVCRSEQGNVWPDGSGRDDISEVVLRTVVADSVERLNPKVPAAAREGAVAELLQGRSAMSDILANRAIYGLLRDGVDIQVENDAGRTVAHRVRLIDWDSPENNRFQVVSQMAIRKRGSLRIPDLLLMVNGLPLVFIELKNSNVAVETAYTKNLSEYKADILPLFHYNAVCILSNGVDTRLGSYNAGYEHFFTWLRVEQETEKIDRQSIANSKTSLDYALRGLCRKDRLLDYIENFILFHKDTQKIVAKNHQFLGVNNAVRAFEDRRRLKGRLGVFWHTQGSGKSFSMIFYARKIFRKFGLNHTFVVITDREDLDQQIYENFLHTKTVAKKEGVRPANAKQLREYLGDRGKRFVFSLIQKFRFDKGKSYPLLSERDDIIVLVDESHRSQYESLAENMRVGLPNAGYVAFTGTPLLGRGPERHGKTHEWFGEYVSEYTFSQSIADGATVPLFYEKRVPEVLIENPNLDEDFLRIVEDEDLSLEQHISLSKKFSKELEVIKRSDRLDKIAQDIVKHFPYRGYRGKAMVISVDKFTTVRMYEKVRIFWDKEKQDLQRRINKQDPGDERDRLQSVLEYMRDVEMAVVISEEAGEEGRFRQEGLSITEHREKLNRVDSEGNGVEAYFKDPEHPLQIVFVCSMWLTGFDAPTVSTLYLDKPMKNHTLMQAIARANRVAPGKKHGFVVDYYNVFRNMKKALADYGGGELSDDDANQGDDLPVQSKDKLFALLDEALAEGDAFCKRQGVDLGRIVAQDEIFSKISLFEEFADILVAKEEIKKEYFVYENAIDALYDACKPDIFEQKRERPLLAVFAYLRGVIEGKIARDGLESARRRISALLDDSVLTDEDALGRGGRRFDIKRNRLIDLSKLDFQKLKDSFQGAPYKNIEIDDLKRFIERKLTLMLKTNENRSGFFEKYRAIVEAYNAGGASTDEFFRDLMRFAENLKDEDERHIREGLSEEELEYYDLLKKEKLTREEEQSVKNAARRLLHRLYEEQPRVLTADWFKFAQPQANVRGAIEETLNDTLPDSYDRKIYKQKCDSVFDVVLRRSMEGEVG